MGGNQVKYNSANFNALSTIGADAMVIKRRTILTRSIPFLLIGLLILVLYLHFFIGIEDLIQLLQSVNLLYYSLAFVVSLLSVAFYSLTWQHLLNLLSIKIGFPKTFLFVWVATFVDILIPAESISSEISKAYLVSRSAGQDTGKAVASIVSHRILSMAITVTALIISSALLIIKYELSTFILIFMIIVMIGTVISIVLLSYLSFKEQTTWKVVNKILGFVDFVSRGRWQLTNLKTKAQKMLKMFHEGITTLIEHPRNLALPVVFSLLAWVFDVLISFFVFISVDEKFVYSLGFDNAFVVIVIVYTLGMAVQYFPLGIPAEVGLTEIFMTSLYTLLGIPLDISAVATVLTRILTVWFRFFVGYASFVRWIGTEFLVGDG